MRGTFSEKSRVAFWDSGLRQQWHFLEESGRNSELAWLERLAETVALGGRGGVKGCKGQSTQAAAIQDHVGSWEIILGSRTPGQTCVLGRVTCLYQVGQRVSYLPHL